MSFMKFMSFMKLINFMGSPPVSMCAHWYRYGRTDTGARTGAEMTQNMKFI